LDRILVRPLSDAYDRDTNRDGTLYDLLLPRSVPSVAEKLRIKSQPPIEEDFFTDPAKRRMIYERDRWRCFYCGERVTEENITLDHYEPLSKGGTNAKENLKTACLQCNSIKSGKTYDEAIPYLYCSIQERAKGRHSNEA
jgi:5-methylcytosine-specific restriction endonuclease McrA